MKNTFMSYENMGMNFKKTIRQHLHPNMTAAQKQIQSALLAFIEERNDRAAPGRPCCYYMTDESARELARLPPETSLNDILDSDPLFRGVLQEDVVEREVVASFMHDTLRGHIVHFCERMKRGAVQPCGLRASHYVSEGDSQRWYCGSIHKGCVMQILRSLGICNNDPQTSCTFPPGFSFPERKQTLYCYCALPNDKERSMVNCSGDAHCPGNTWFHEDCLQLFENLSAAEL